MWAAIRILRLSIKSFTRMANALEQIRDLYRADLASRGVILTDTTIKDAVEVEYSHAESNEEDW